MSSLRARLRAAERDVTDVGTSKRTTEVERFENHRTRSASIERASEGLESPRTPREVTARVWEPSTRSGASPWDSASGRRARWTSVKAATKLTTPRRTMEETRARDVRDRELDVNAARAVSGSFAVVSGEGTATKKTGGQTRDVSFEQDDVEAEVLKILRDVVADAKRARASGLDSKSCVKSQDGDDGRDEKALVSISSRGRVKERNESLARMGWDFGAIIIGSITIAMAVVGFLFGFSVARFRSGNGDVGYRISPQVKTRVEPATNSLMLDGIDFEASWNSTLLRAKTLHDSLTDDDARRRIRSAAKRARDARRLALEASSSEEDENDTLVRATCRAVIAFSELERFSSVNTSLDHAHAEPSASRQVV